MTRISVVRDEIAAANSSRFEKNFEER